MSNPAGARILRGLSRLFFVSAALLALDAGFYWRYLRATSQPLPQRPFARPVRHVPERTLLRLGWLGTDRESSFVLSEAKKRPGVVRIGCLGDSFTYGAEVGRSEDYPSILQRLFRDRGYPQVEVVNFGSEWYGFQQTFLLWDEVARFFDLDFVLLGPKTFFFQRDTTFDHSSPSAIHSLHARQVLEGDGLRTVEVAGVTYADCSAGYRRFLPYWRYLRYDRRAPAFLSCLVPRGRELPNPFYYRRDIKGELDEIYRRQLRRMTESGAQVVLGTQESRILDLARGLGLSRLHALLFEESRQFPYRAPKQHASPAGNRLLAEQFFSVLTGKTGSSLPTIVLDRTPPSLDEPRRAAPASLDAYRSVFVATEGGAPWHFVEIGSGMLSRALPDDFFRKNRVASLLAFEVPGQPLAQAVFFPLPIVLRDGMRLLLRSERGETVLGEVSLLGPGLPVGVVGWTGPLGPDFAGFNGTDAVFTARGPMKKSLPGTVFLGGRAVFHSGRAGGGGKIFLHPILRRFLQIYAPPELLGGWAGRKAGLLSLHLQPEVGAGVSYPLAAWRRSDKDMLVSFEQKDLPPPVKRPGR